MVTKFVRFSFSLVVGINSIIRRLFSRFQAILIQSNRKNQYQIQGIDYPACQNSVDRTDIFVENDRRMLKEIRVGVREEKQKSENLFFLSFRATVLLWFFTQKIHGKFGSQQK